MKLGLIKFFSNRFIFSWFCIFITSLSPIYGHCKTPQSEPIDQIAQKYMSQLHLTGLALAKIKFNSKNNTYDVWHKEYGYANLEERTPVNAHTQFLLASVTKTFTGLIVANAINDGVLSLDTNVNGVIKKFQVNNPEKQTITLKDLVTHRSQIIDSENYLYTSLYRDKNNELQSLYTCCGFDHPLAHFNELKNTMFLAFIDKFPGASTQKC